MKTRLWLGLLLLGMSGSGAAGWAQAQDEPIQTAPVSTMSAEQIEQQFTNEPTLQQVYQMAEHQIGVRPEMIGGWLSKASRRNILPTLRANFRYTKDDDLSASDTSSFREDPDRVIIGPLDTTAEDDNQYQFQVTATWDLPELIFDRSAKANAVLMAQRAVSMRNDLLSQVSSIYFERRRHQIELMVSPPADVLLRAHIQLRIDELTAQLDVLTDGQFTHPSRGRK